jgi:hypothetical protein
LFAFQDPTKESIDDADVFARPFELIALARYKHFVFYLLLFFFNTLFGN